MSGKAKGRAKMVVNSPSGVGKAAATFQPRAFAVRAEEALPPLPEGMGHSPFDAYLESTRGAEPTRTDFPNRLQEGLEQLSGRDLSGVRVHYNSAKPARLQALAYAQGEEIHLGPGQEEHLPHEGWHVVQQIEKRVKPTGEVKGVAINDDEGLEREADVMGARAMQKYASAEAPTLRSPARPGTIGDLVFGTQALPIVQTIKKDPRDRQDVFSDTIMKMDPYDFFADIFAQNHVYRRSKLKNETPPEATLRSAADRGLADQTLLFLEKSESRQLAEEIREKNASKYYYKQIRRRGGVPANVFFDTDSEVEYVTVNAAGGYHVTEWGVGRVNYTVANTGDRVRNIPLFEINHLEEMHQTQDLFVDDLEDLEEEDLEGSEEHGEVEEYGGESDLDF